MVNAKSIIKTVSELLESDQLSKMHHRVAMHSLSKSNYNHDKAADHLKKKLKTATSKVKNVKKAIKHIDKIRAAKKVSRTRSESERKAMFYHMAHGTKK